MAKTACRCNWAANPLQLTGLLSRQLLRLIMPAVKAVPAAGAPTGPAAERQPVTPNRDQMTAEAQLPTNVVGEIRARSPRGILEGQLSEQCVQGLVQTVRARMECRLPRIDYVRQYDIVVAWLGSGDDFLRLRAFSQKYFGDDISPCPYVLEVLLEAFEPEEAGVWSGDRVVDSRESSLEFDKDGLLVGPSNSVEFTRWGVLTDSNLLLYDGWMPGNGTSGGFVEALLRYREQFGATQFGMAIRADILYARRHFHPYETRAYIRGPRGISRDQLQDSAFPEDPRGVVTTHQYAGESVASHLFPAHRIEVMWSRKRNAKTVQIEELVEERNPINHFGGRIQNRYVHARWDTDRSTFVHFDGAIRTYSKSRYLSRLSSDLRAYDGKASGYRKLFRVDGSMSLEIWEDLVARYFEQNELVLEYLGGPDPERAEYAG